MERRCGGVRDRILGITSVHRSGLRLSITVGRCVPAVICLKSRGWRDNWPEVTEHGSECWLPTLSSTGRRVGDAGRSVSVVVTVHVTAASGVGIRQVTEQDVAG